MAQDPSQHGQSVPPAGDGAGLLAPIFVSPAFAELFSDRALLQAMLDFQSGLARAEADCGVIPGDCVESISKACHANLYDIDEIGRQAALAGNPAIPLVKALTGEVSGDAARFVHWGATSQDVMDSALMLLARSGLTQIAADLTGAIEAAISLAEKHNGTILAGRTLMQQALPITFAAKVSVWLSGLVAARRRVRQLAGENLAVQFAGAVGTLAALGEDGPAVRATLAKTLNLPDPGGPWHTERARIADIACGLGLLSGSVSKIATDVMLLMQSEVGEAAEPAGPGRGGSSTMPHKRNPVAAAAIRANHRRIVGLVPTMLMIMEHEHERGLGAWAAEWETFRDVFRLAGGSAALIGQTVAGLEINEAAMADNLNRSAGQVMAESLMMALATGTGKAKAHSLVENASRRAVREKRDLAAIAIEDPEINGHLSPEEIRAAFSPATYLGTSDDVVARTLALARAELEVSFP